VFYFLLSILDRPPTSDRVDKRWKNCQGKDETGQDRFQGGGTIPQHATARIA
jgi:hypothetical protein